MRRLPREVKNRLDAAFDRLKEDPHQGEQTTKRPYWKYRVGNWRIVYAIREAQILIWVVDLGPRGDIYR